MKRISHVSKLQLIKLLKKLNFEDRKCLLRFLNDDGMKTVCSCISNVLFEDWNLKTSLKQKLRRISKGKEKDMKLLANDGNTLQRQKTLIIQHGGGILSLILGVAIPILTDLIFKATSKK